MSHLQDRLERYAKLHEAMRAGRVPPRFLVYTCDASQDGTPVGVGGYADRLTGVLSCALLALLTDRALLIQWETPFRLADHLSPNRIDWSFNYQGLVPEGPPPHLMYLIDRFGDPAVQDTFTHRDLEQEVFQGNPVVVFMVNSHLAELLLHNPHYRDELERMREDPNFHITYHRHLFPFLFKPRLPKAFCEQVFAPLLAAIEASYAIGIQFRTGGGGKWIDPLLARQSDYRLFFAEAERIIAGLGGRPFVIYFATDSEEVKEKVLAEYGPRYGERLLHLDQPIIHTERSEPEQVAAGAGFVIAEHLLLSQCDRLIIGRGGFGRSAAWIGGKEPLIIDTHQWLSEEEKQTVLGV